MDRDALVYDASQEAADARDDAGMNQDAPIAIFDITPKLGADVLFADIDMEGIYERSFAPRVILSPYRPLVRRAFNCAHELGHHRYGHGSTIHELKSVHENKRPSEIPEEIAANAFAGFFMMPALGIERALHRRKTTSRAVSPFELYAIACDFGVGYKTLVTHLGYGLREIGESRKRELEKWKVQDLRRQVLGYAESSPLIVLDELSETSTVEIEVQSAILVPTHTKLFNNVLLFERQVRSRKLYRAVRQGYTSIEIANRPIEIRVMPKRYLGWAQYRYMEDPDDQL
jgi:Zn-dependent peptidase ImmA (M78 family)